jgi:hypothetical protein
LLWMPLQARFFVHHQVSLASGETIQACLQSCRLLEKTASAFVRFIPIMHPSMQVNAATILRTNKRRLRLSPVLGLIIKPASWSVQSETITSWARTMMLHSIIHWPDSADLELWPFAMDHTVYLWNSLPRKDTFLSPNKLYTRIHNVD